jgi:hypothetical protein
MLSAKCKMLAMLAVAQFGFSFSPPLARAGVRRCLILKCLPLTPALSPFGGERESDAYSATSAMLSGNDLMTTTDGQYYFPQIGEPAGVRLRESFIMSPGVKS